MSTDDSFVAFVSARSARLVAYAELLCGDRERARDLVQSVLTRAYPRWDRIEQDDPYGYLCRAVTNAVTDWWRRAHRRRERLVETLPENSSIVDETSGLDDRRPGGRGAQQSDHADPVRRSVRTAAAAPARRPERADDHRR